MAKKSSSGMMRGDVETIDMLRSLKHSMGDDEFKGFVRKQYKMHHFFKKLFKAK